MVPTFVLRLHSTRCVARGVIWNFHSLRRNLKFRRSSDADLNSLFLLQLPGGARGGGGGTIRRLAVLLLTAATTSGSTSSAPLRCAIRRLILEIFSSFFFRFGRGIVSSGAEL